jgi:hypothetical protein
MKKLFLVANTDLPIVETAVEKALNKTKTKLAEFERLSRYTIVQGRVADAGKIMHCEVVIFLGPPALRNNQEFIGPDTVGIMLGDPLNLGCVTGSGVEPLDYTAKDDGLGFFLHTLTVKDIGVKILKALKEPTDPALTVGIECLDMVPTIINSAKSNTTFVDTFAKITYSVRDELVRNKLKAALLVWFRSKESVSVLEDQFIKLMGKSNSKVKFLTEMFADDNDRGKQVRAAVRSVLSAVIAAEGKKNANINYEKIADNYKLSAYDLRYIANMYRNSDKLLIENTESSLVHLANMRARYVNTSL